MQTSFAELTLILHSCFFPSSLVLNLVLSCDGRALGFWRKRSHTHPNSMRNLTHIGW